MTSTSTSHWESKRTDETRQVEDLLRRAGFAQVDAYRYNAASIRVRVIDPRFEGRSAARRDAMVERVLKQLPESTQADILALYTFAPSELQRSFREFLQNNEFEDPSPSML